MRLDESKEYSNTFRQNDKSSTIFKGIKRLKITMANASCVCRCKDSLCAWVALARDMIF